MVETACTICGSCSAGSVAQSAGSRPLGTTVTGTPVCSRSGSAAASLTAFKARCRAMSGLVHGVRMAGSRNVGFRQCTVTATGRPSLSPTRTPAAANGDPTPAWTCTRSKLPRRSAFSIGWDGNGLFAISAGIGIPKRCTGTGNTRPAIRRGNGVAVITSGCSPIPNCRRVRSLTCISMPPSRGTKQSEMCATRTTHPASVDPHEPCDMLALCVIPSFSFTPIPMTRRYSPRARWPSSRPPGTAWCWWWPPPARVAWPPTATGGRPPR